MAIRSSIVPWDETPEEKKQRKKNLSPEHNAYIDYCKVMNDALYHRIRSEREERERKRERNKE